MSIDGKPSPASRELRSKRYGPTAPCVCCGEVDLVVGRGLIRKCYSRVARNDQLKRWPYTLKRTACVVLKAPEAIDRAMAYGELTTGVSGKPGRGWSRTRACTVLSITERTAYRYEAWLRSQATE